MSEATTIPGLIIASPNSGAGKTTIALGIMRALRRRGLSVQPFKSGPDYIDPAFHKVAAGRESINLDSWAMSEALIFSLINTTSKDADIVVAEGAMGLFDGAPAGGQSGNGSVADLAAITGWPVLLVIDIARQAQSAAAIASGCETYRNDVSIAGVILNRVASPRHESLVQSEMSRAGVQVLGALPRANKIGIPERHLGLVQAQESSGTDEVITNMSDLVETHVDIDGIIASAMPCHPLTSSTAADRQLPPPPGERIALAQDDAFSFVYPHILNHWGDRGAAIQPFSPLKDEGPETTADAIWLPGGYPELHAEKIANAQNFHNTLVKCAQAGVPVHGECGGYMVLGKTLEDAHGKTHRMVGLLNHTTSFAYCRLHLGYRRARLLIPSALGSTTTNLSGHEFHYATLQSSCDDDPLAETFDATGEKLSEGGSRRGSVSGTFFHMIAQVNE